MECWYDTLFECDCAGIDALMNVACAGRLLTASGSRTPDGRISGMYGFIDTKLWKRFRWIAACSGLLSFGIAMFDDWKRNIFKVFIQVYSVYSYPFPEYPWYYEVKKLVPNRCYYLGQFPFNWDYKFGTPYTPLTWPYTLTPIKAPPLSAEAIAEGSKLYPRVRPFSMIPSLQSGEYLPLHIYTGDDLTFFHGKNAAENVARQIAFITQRKRTLQSCLMKRYPAPFSEKKKEVQTPQGPKDWPGKETKDLTLPETQAPPPEPPWGSSLLSLSMLFGETPPTRPDGMSLTLSL